MVLKVMMLLGFIMLTACATKGSESSINPVAEEQNPELVSEQKALPQAGKTEISPDVLFLLMTAEIAGQRGQYELALDGYLRASERVKDVEVIKRAAKIALYVQDDAKLKQALDLWLEEEPDSLDARYLVAVAALKSGDRQGAFDNIEFISLKDAVDFDAKAIAMVKNLQNPQSVALAYQVFSDLSAQYPDNPKLYFVLALMDAQAQKLRLAEANVSKALELDPQWVKALMLQAQLYISRGKLTAAIGVLQQVDEHEESVQIKEQIAQLLMQQGRFSEAEDVLQGLIEKHPENKGLNFKLALVYLQTGQEDSARNILQALVIDKEFRDRASFYLGRIDAKAKRFDEALIWFDVISAGPYRYEASMSSVFILIEQKQYELALLRLKSLKADFPDKASDLVLVESELYSQQHLYQQSFDVLTSELLNAPDNKKILYARALVAEKLDKLQVLEDDLKYILEKDPNDANALNALGYTLVDKTNRYAEAQGYLDKAIAIKPNEPIIMDSYGWVLFKLNRLEESRQYLQRAYDLQPQAEIAAHLIEVLWALQQSRQAQAVFAEAIEKTPDDPLLLELKVRLFGSD
ncbi:hypothetical protein BPLS_P2001 [Bathymodiolus platifrons methanotrophic gill symbiont]|uniref:tetratricopeptide repeat protein n=1 Tax=Bathymodiolus platifrons methanotrophic gill symbiont TaxID=113268 RepID=UPI0011CC968F|nr:tetratricopeptide repeat protein [Bathymodiolus platifrons methanotrophic gill symbiont]TXL01842.1 hypothetical protein BMR02_01805 [Methylococcaceae bacterium HT1]TXL23380.1 hypothetical protein BMR03_02420 [Methylococcaceae bacterium HT2]GFO75009.1 hypothetical protein BPLS_P2001 [Bathymodiolus platifrons methanotrophic gill symbiont]